MSAEQTMFDVDVDAAVAAAAATIGEIFGLGDEQAPGSGWPIGDGDRVLAFAFSGDLSGVLMLGVDEGVAARLEADAGSFLDGFAQAVAAAAEAVGASLTLGEAVAAERTPNRSVEIFDAGRLRARVGLALDAAAAPSSRRGAGANGSAQEPAPAASVFEPVPMYGGTGHGAGTVATPLSLLHDVDMEVTVELGRTTMPIRDLLALQPGMVVEIDRAAGGPIDVLVNGRLIACGEVVVIDEEFGIRITEIVSPGAHA